MYHWTFAHRERKLYSTRSSAASDPDDSGRHIQSTPAENDRRGQLIATVGRGPVAAQVSAGCGRHNSCVRRPLCKRCGGTSTEVGRAGPRRLRSRLRSRSGPRGQEPGFFEPLPCVDKSRTRLNCHWPMSAHLIHYRHFCTGARPTDRPTCRRAGRTTDVDAEIILLGRR